MSFQISDEGIEYASEMTKLRASICYIRIDVKHPREERWVGVEFDARKLRPKTREFLDRIAHDNITPMDFNVMEAITHLNYYPMHDAMNRYAEDPSPKVIKRILTSAKIADALREKAKMKERLAEEFMSRSYNAVFANNVMVAKAPLKDPLIVIRSLDGYFAFTVREYRYLAVGSALMGRPLAKYMRRIPLDQAIPYLKDVQTHFGDEKLEELIADMEVYAVANRLAGD